MISKTGLTILNKRKRIEVFTPEEVEEITKSKAVIKTIKKWLK